jgi:hypothetical protein
MFRKVKAQSHAYYSRRDLCFQISDIDTFSNFTVGIGIWATARVYTGGVLALLEDP